MEMENSMLMIKLQGMILFLVKFELYLFIDLFLVNYYCKFSCTNIYIFSLNLLVVLVMVIILGYLWLTTPLNIITRYFGYSYQAESVVTRLGAFHQLFLFLVTYLMYIVFNE